MQHTGERPLEYRPVRIEPAPFFIGPIRDQFVVVRNSMQDSVDTRYSEKIQYNHIWSSVAQYQETQQLWHSFSRISIPLGVRWPPCVITLCMLASMGASANGKRISAFLLTVTTVRLSS